eukprot:ctg_1373.g374
MHPSRRRARVPAAHRSADTPTHPDAAAPSAWPPAAIADAVAAAREPQLRSCAAKCRTRRATGRSPCAPASPGRCVRSTSPPSANPHPTSRSRYWTGSPTGAACSAPPTRSARALQPRQCPA